PRERNYWIGRRAMEKVEGELRERVQHVRFVAQIVATRSALARRPVRHHRISPIRRVFVEPHADRLHAFLLPAMLRALEPARKLNRARNRFEHQRLSAFWTRRFHSGPIPSARFAAHSTSVAPTANAS